MKAAVLSAVHFSIPYNINATDHGLSERSILVGDDWWRVVLIITSVMFIVNFYVYSVSIICLLLYVLYVSELHGVLNRVIIIYIKVTWASAVCYCHAAWVSGWGSYSSRAGLHHLPFPSFRNRVWLCLSGPVFLIDSIINSTRRNPLAVPS